MKRRIFDILKVFFAINLLNDIFDWEADVEIYNFSRLNLIFTT